MKQTMPDLSAIVTRENFESVSLATFRFQVENCKIYREFVNHLHIHPETVRRVSQIPFLPVSLFKNHRIYCGSDEPEILFTSSGTTGSQTSVHEVASLRMYENSFKLSFNLFYGSADQYILLVMLPGYLERTGSSLVYMAEQLIKATSHPLSGFYLHDTDRLLHTIEKARNTNRKILLLGVTHSLVSLAIQHQPDLTGAIVMETGGMKGHGREMVRSELHQLLCERFRVPVIHSEYGMTELLSQAYSKGNGLFQCPPWMKILTRDTDDPLTLRTDSRTGGINVIDLANRWSCSFLATQDLGRVHENGEFEVMGRFDNSDVRGCNLLIPD